VLNLTVVLISKWSYC